MSPSRLYAFLSARWWLTFLLLGVSFVLFGLVSLNLLHLLGANLGFLARFGFDAVREGALVQLVELVLSGYAAAAFYLLFKLCERVLVDRLSTRRAAEPAVATTVRQEPEGEAPLRTPAQPERASQT